MLQKEGEKQNKAFYTFGVLKQRVIYLEERF